MSNFNCDASEEWIPDSGKTAKHCAKVKTGLNAQCKLPVVSTKLVPEFDALAKFIRFDI